MTTAIAKLISQLPPAIVGITLLGLSVGSGSASANIERTEQMQFDIEFDGRPMGQHIFEVTYESASRVRVASQVEMRYRLAFITLFRYQHSASERWEDGCLTELSSKTNDDGDRYALTGTRTDAGFAVEHRKPEVENALIDEQCPATFAYWQPALLERSALINAQTGRLESVQVARGSQTMLNDAPAEHWTIETESEGTIELWYAANTGRWLQLQHTSAQGKLLYRRTDS